MKIMISTMLLLLLVPVSAFAWQWKNPEQARKQFHKIVDEYFDEEFKYHPTSGTSSGFHQYDSKLEDVSQNSIQSEIRFLHGILREFEKIPEDKLEPADQIDLEMVKNDIQSKLLDMETIKNWKRNPDVYSSGVTGSAFTIMSRTYAPAEERLKALVAREKLMPKFIAQGKKNVVNPPKIFTQVAIDQIPGNVGFFEKDVPEAFKDVKNEKLLKEFKTSNEKVIEALKEYGAWLKSTLLPKSNGDFRLGEELYRKKLLYEEMVDEPLDHLLDIGYANLKANQQAFKETAAKIDSKKTAQQILDEAVKDHPEPDKLLQSFRDTLGGLKDFLVKNKIVTVPSDVLPIIEETPPFARALTFASMDTPGPYEKVAKEAYFNVTLPEKDWTKEKIDGHMEAFNRGTIISTAIHEAYPGHYIQFLNLQNIKSKVRKLTGCGSNAEGWAHYVEQMMLDEGYGAGDLKLRLGQLQDALLRNARYIVGIKMHTGKLTYDEAIDFFVKEGYQSRENSEREAKRGTMDPTYLVYTLGKLEILKLRDDYKAMKGEKYSLQEFHDEFLKQGTPPLKLVRRALLGKDGPMLPKLAVEQGDH